MFSYLEPWDVSIEQQWYCGSSSGIVEAAVVFWKQQWYSGKPIVLAHRKRLS
jgi:hypothetical protein